MQDRHEFALYSPNLTIELKTVSHDRTLTIRDQSTITRVGGVLRLRPGETFVVFDTTVSAHCSVLSISKKELICSVLNQTPNKPLSPTITFLLPLLKKDDFETALYSLVELGTTTIQLIATQKTQRSWAGEKELDRCQRIMIAAAEQSKNFIIPTLIPPIHLTEYLKKITENEHPKIYFDPQGSAGLALLNNLAQQKAKHYMLMVGPEGDLTQSEKELLQAKSFYFCQLTPTVLRSVSAVILGAGIMRTLMRKN